MNEEQRQPANPADENVKESGDQDTPEQPSGTENPPATNEATPDNGQATEPDTVPPSGDKQELAADEPPGDEADTSGDSAPETSSVAETAGRGDFRPRVPSRPPEVLLVPSQHPDGNAKVRKAIEEFALPHFVYEPAAPGAQQAAPLATIFREHNIVFAVVMLSGDEWVYPKNGKPAEARLRATQQNVFCLGYCLGKLGARKTFILYKDQRAFQLPTKYYEAGYIPLDQGDTWKRELRQRMQGAGILR